MAETAKLEKEIVAQAGDKAAEAQQVAAQVGIGTRAAAFHINCIFYARKSLT